MPVTQRTRLFSTKSKKAVAEKSAENSAGRYWSGVGRRKSATAFVKVFEEAGSIIVNGKEAIAYFQKDLEELLGAPLSSLGLSSNHRVEASVSGGGIRGQAEAIRLGIARALLKKDPSWKKSLRANGLVTRDPRAKERKKYGLKRARRAPQWTKR